MKKPNGIREWIVFIFTAVGIIATICFAYQALTDRVGVTEKTVTKIEGKVELHDTAITKMEGDVSRIKEDTSEIKADIKEILWRWDQ